MPSQSAAATLETLREAFEGLFAAQRRLRGRDTKVVGGITLAQLRLLRMLVREGPMPSSRLAAAVGISPSSTTQVLDALARRGMVERSRPEHDRRVVVIQLTAEGRRRAEASRTEHQAIFEKVFAGLDDRERAAGVEVLRRCGAYLDAL